MVLTKQYKSGNKLRWLQEYDELRERGVGMRTAMRAAYEVVQRAVKEAAREKGARRGVRSMFERENRQQEAQAWERALEDEVPCDEANGGPQDSRQGQRLGGAGERTGAYRKSGTQRKTVEAMTRCRATRGLAHKGESIWAACGRGRQLGRWEVTPRCELKRRLLGGSLS